MHIALDIEKEKSLHGSCFTFPIFLTSSLARYEDEAAKLSKISADAKKTAERSEEAKAESELLGVAQKEAEDREMILRQSVMELTQQLELVSEQVLLPKVTVLNGICLAGKRSPR